MPQCDNENNNDESCYDCDITFWIYVVYAILIALWIFIICYFGYIYMDGWALLAIPFITFAISMINISKIGYDLEDSIFRPTNLSLGLVIAIPLFSWMGKNYGGDKTTFSSIVIVALILSLFTLIDIWLQRCWLTIYKHIRSSFQTMSITLFMFALINYYLNCNIGYLG